MPNIKYEGEEAAYRALEKTRDPRYYELDQLEAYVETRQYADRPNFWTDQVNGKDIPLWERAPIVAYPVVQAAIDSNVDLCLGEGRFPEITAKPSAENKEITVPQAEKLDALIADIIRQSKFRKLAREVFEHGQGTGTAVAIFGVRGGKLFADTTKAKWCKPDFGPDGSVRRLEIRYGYLDRFRNERGKWELKAKLYRRVIDEQQDVTFFPADADEQGNEPKWKPDPAQSFKHGLGFCPVIWYAHMKGCSTVAEIDGKAIHRLALDEIEALDFSLSQRHRVALFSEPQLVEIGVPPGYNPTESASRDYVPSTETGGPLHPIDNPQTSHYDLGAGSKRARKKGPGFAYQYASDKVKVQWLQMSSEAIKPLDEDARDLRIKVAETLAVVFMDPDTVKFASALSGKALDILRARQFDRCDKYREDLGEEFLIPAVGMLLRIALARADVLGGINVKPLTGLIEKIFERLDAVLTLKFGSYTKPDPSENKDVGEAAKNARDARLISNRTAARAVAPLYGVENIDEELDQIEKDSAEAAEKAAEQMGAEPGAEPPEDPKEAEDENVRRMPQRRAN